jgi:hypothetical protein
MSSAYTVVKHDRAQSFLQACEAALLRTRPTQANVTLTNAKHVAATEATLTPSTPSASVNTKPLLYTITIDHPILLQSSSDAFPLVFALSRSNAQSAVLASSASPSELTPEVVKGTMNAFVGACLSDGLSGTQLLSTFGPRALVDAFAHAWVEANKLTLKDNPLMHMYNTYVTKETLRPSVRPQVDSNVTLRKVKIEELEVAAELLLQFYFETGRCTHTLEIAMSAAKQFIDDEEMFGVWVNGALKGFSVATRPTPGVMAIAHVYTDPDTRGKGLAEIIVRYTCEQ